MNNALKFGLTIAIAFASVHSHSQTDNEVREPVSTKKASQEESLLDRLKQLEGESRGKNYDELKSIISDDDLVFLAMLLSSESHIDYWVESVYLVGRSGSTDVATLVLEDFIEANVDPGKIDKFQFSDILYSKGQALRNLGLLGSTAACVRLSAMLDPNVASEHAAPWLEAIPPSYRDAPNFVHSYVVSNAAIGLVFARHREGIRQIRDIVAGYEREFEANRERYKNRLDISAEDWRKRKEYGAYLSALLYAELIDDIGLSAAVDLDAKDDSWQFDYYLELDWFALNEISFRRN